MKILHTSDWHIGRSLHGRKRYDEFAGFLNWLAELIQSAQIDVLLVAGDVFDTNTPSNRAQELYYQFLCRAAFFGGCPVIITAGNHDSPSFLNAPKQLLNSLNIHVIGAASQNPEDEVIVITGKSEKEKVIVCAVPYLRDRDIRTVEAGESVEEKSRKLIEGIQKHYADVAGIAMEKQKSLGPVPIIGMGHLFTMGGKTTDGDGVRELYVGSLIHVRDRIFPSCFDYMALGHLHISQHVGSSEYIRYSGSPIPMGFGEAKQEKSVVIVEFDSSTAPNRGKKIILKKVPCFQPLKTISGDLDSIIDDIHELKKTAAHAWLEIEYVGTESAAVIRERTEEALVDSKIEILRIKNKRMMNHIIQETSRYETLNELSPEDVFLRCMAARNVPDDARIELIKTYREALAGINETDIHAE